MKARTLSFGLGLLKTNWWEKTTLEALTDLGFKGKIITLLTALWGYHGSMPSESSFAIHCLVRKHFWKGAYYPRGGAKVISE